MKGTLPAASSIQPVWLGMRALWAEEWIQEFLPQDNMGKGRTKNHAEKTRSKKPNFGGHQTEEGQGHLGVRIWGWTSVVRDRTTNTCDLGMSLCACVHTWGWWNSSK